MWYNDAHSEGELSFRCASCPVEIVGPFQTVMVLLQLHQHQHLGEFGRLDFYEFVRAVHNDLL